MTTQLGTMKVVDIQDKLGYSLVTFEIPDDCKQFLIEHAMRDLITKAANETKAKFGSVLPETTLGLDNQTNQVYNANTAHNGNETDEDTDGWIPNKGVQPVAGDVLVDVMLPDGEICTDAAGEWYWFLDVSCCISHWRLSKSK